MVKTNKPTTVNSISYLKQLFCRLAIDRPQETLYFLYLR